MSAPPIDVKSAVRAAIDYVQEFRDFISANGIRLEETEYDEQLHAWLITLSTIDDSDLKGTFGVLAGPRRTYRVFSIDADTGHVKSMKVRVLQHDQ